MKRGKVAIAAVIAAGVGYVGGILTAPRSGQRTRKRLGDSASKTMTEGEKQLKKLYSELADSIKQGEKQVTKAKTKANNELKEAVKSGKEARQKARLILTALHEGDADDPNLKAVLAEVSAAKKHLGRFIKSAPAAAPAPVKSQSSPKPKTRSSNKPKTSTKAKAKTSTKRAS